MGGGAMGGAHGVNGGGMPPQVPPPIVTPLHWVQQISTLVKFDGVTGKMNPGNNEETVLMA